MTVIDAEPQLLCVTSHIDKRPLQCRPVSHPKHSIPVIDIFAGPGGLGEGFGRFRVSSKRAFRSVLSIEKEASAHWTLTLRAFYRQFDPSQAPPAYFDRVRGRITTEALFARHPREAEAARVEAWHAELGSEAYSVDTVRGRVAAALGSAEEWVLLGGPPCQAYSLAGRSRNRGVAGYRFETDQKSTLYLEYLQLIADFWPAVFVMENVKGLLSAKMNGDSMFARITDDLADPATAITREGRTRRRGTQQRYDLYPIVATDDVLSGMASADARSFLVQAEQYGIPQARHRLIIIGVRRDFRRSGPRPLTPHDRPILVREMIADLPKLRSGLSKDDSAENWSQTLQRLGRPTWQSRIRARAGNAVASRIAEIAGRADELARRPRTTAGTSQRPCIQYRRDWFEADLMPCIANHESRTHMAMDLLRYLFASGFTEKLEHSPDLRGFPTQLLPAHKNAKAAVVSSHFTDRFRVQRFDHPSTTITSHISRDGHYYIHPDPEQCRSLTVREAARLQTFPDTYLFEGNRTAQYTQVGNAVPPLLAHQIAQRVYDLFR